MDDYEKQARQLADHCRYCDKQGLKCKDDLERQIEEIAVALREAEMAGMHHVITAAMREAEERGMHLLCSHDECCNCRVARAEYHYDDYVELCEMHKLAPGKLLKAQAEIEVLKREIAELRKTT